MKKLSKRIGKFITSVRRTIKTWYYTIQAKSTKNWYKKAKLSLKALSVKFCG